MNTNTLRKVEQLSDQLDTAESASEVTTKELQRARRTVKSVKRAVRSPQKPDSTKHRPRRSRDRYTDHGKIKAAVELGRKGGAARAKTLTRQQRSALARKAAKARWNRY